MLENNMKSNILQQRKNFKIKGNSMDKYVIGLDIGGMNMRGALLNRDEERVDELKIPSEADQGIERLVDNLGYFIEKILGGKTIYGVGLGIPGIIDSTKGVLTAAPNIKGVHNYPIRDVLTEKLDRDIKLVIENDANMVGLGEWRKGVGRGVNSMIMMTIGTGLGGGLILDGELWSGAHGMGGEIGHMTINPEGPKCNCGNHGCLETYASAVAIRRMVSEALSDGGVVTSLRDKVRDAGPGEIPELVMEAAHGGDEAASGIWQEVGRALGIAIASLQNLLDVDMVVLGGGVANAWDLFIDTVKKEAGERGFSAPMEKLAIEKSALGDDAGILGAGYLALQK